MGLAVAGVCGAITVSASSSATPGHRPQRAPAVAAFPQGIAPLTGSGLLSAGRHVYYEMLDQNGNTTIGRIAPSGRTRMEATSGAGYSYAPPTRTTDGGVWLAVDTGGGGARADTPNLSLAGLNPAATRLKVRPTPGYTLDGWPTVADRHGRFWAQGNTPGVGIIAVAAGLRAPLVSVQTQLGPVSSQSDITVNNPMVLGPRGRVWMLGGDGFGAGLRVTSVGPGGVGADVAPTGLEVGALALTRAHGRVWTVAADSTAALSAFGVTGSGATTTVATPMFAECKLDAVQPVRARHARLWFTGATSNCARSARLVLAEVDLSKQTVNAHRTRLRGLRRLVSTVVPTKHAAIVAGRSRFGRLAFARVGRHTRVLRTNLRPFVAASQDRYPLIGDRHKGAWAQAVHHHHLVVVHVTHRAAVAIPTGLTPIAREISLAPNGDLWTQGTAHGHLVLARVTPGGRLTTFATSLSPTHVVLAPAADHRGHLWFRALDPSTGGLVLLRVRTAAPDIRGRPSS